MKGFLVVLLMISVIANVFFLMFERSPEPPPDNGKVPEAEMKQIREIAIACGAVPESVTNMSAKEMLSDIKSVMLDAEPFYCELLQDNDLTTLRNYLNHKKSILTTIENQNKYLSELKGKKILVFPQGNKGY